MFILGNDETRFLIYKLIKKKPREAEREPIIHASPVFAESYSVVIFSVMKTIKVQP